MSEYKLFTSESVSEGHPDKMADQISDAVLDYLLKRDKDARVAVETLVKTGMAIVAGEVTTSAHMDLEETIRQTILDIGYDSSDVGFDGASCAVINAIGKQSPRHRHGRGREQGPRAGRRRPGPDVRLCHQRNRCADARADLLLPSPGRAPGAAAQERHAAVAASRRQEPGDPALRKWQTGGSRCRGAVHPAQTKMSARKRFTSKS